MNGTLSETKKLILFSKQWIEGIKLKQLMQNFENKIITISKTMSTYTTEELENAFEFYDAKQMYKCGNHDDNSKSVRYQAWVTNSNLVNSSIEEYNYYLHNYGSVLTFDHAGNIVCDFDSRTSTNPAPKILLRVPTQEEYDDDEEEYRARRERERKSEHNPEMWKILAMQESARLQECERLREEEDEEKDDEDEEEDLMDMPLRNMNDLQIEKYVERIGRCPRDECDEWTMVYAGCDILRYSYCNFSQWHIEDQTVSNVTITRAIFEDTTFTNYVFDNVTFEECVFKDVILNNTTFKNCKFIECELDSSMVPDKSCEVVNYADDEDHITYY